MTLPVHALDNSRASHREIVRLSLIELAFIPEPWQDEKNMQTGSSLHAPIHMHMHVHIHFAFAFVGKVSESGAAYTCTN